MSRHLFQRHEGVAVSTDIGKHIEGQQKDASSRYMIIRRSRHGQIIQSKGGSKTGLNSLLPPLIPPLSISPVLPEASQIGSPPSARACRNQLRLDTESDELGSVLFIHKARRATWGDSCDCRGLAREAGLWQAHRLMLGLQMFEHISQGV